MTTTSAHEATQTADCKVANCTEPSAAMHGIYGRLCERHAAEKRRERAEQGEHAAERLTRVPRDRETAIRAVLKLTREVDKQTAKVTNLRRSATIAVQRVRDATAELERLEAAYSDAVRAAGIGRPRERA